MVWKCEICGKQSKQKKHHDEHISSNTHKQKVEIFRLEFMSSDVSFLIKRYPEFEDNYNNKEDLVNKIIIKKSNIKQTMKAIKSQTILNFIREISKYSNFEDILKQIKFEPDKDSDGDGIIDKSTRGFYYERLWDICIKFGLTDLTLKPNEDDFTTHWEGNANNDIVTKDMDFWKKVKFENEYLQGGVRSGSSGGYSDITFLNTTKDSEELYLISVKYYEKAKGVKEYDIPELCAIIEKQKQTDRVTNVCIFVKDKIEVIDKFEAQNSSSDILIKYISPGGKYENIYDSQDLHKYYFKLRELLSQYNYFATSKDIQNFETNYLKNLKQPFIPRFHQKLFIDTINDLIINEKKPGVLVGAIPRSGKSFIMAGSILEYVKAYDIKHPQGKKLNFLIITPAPNETFGEYTDIFDGHIDFQNNNIGYKVFKKKINSSDLDKTKHNVIIMSKQKLGWAEPGKEGDEKIEAIKKRINDTFKEIKKDITMMYLDEAHFGMSTEKSMQILKMLETFGNKIPKVYVTATYNKPLKIYNIQPDCKLTWDINDINTMKNLNKTSILDNPIKKRFGTQVYTKALEWRGDKTGKDIVENLKGTYSVYPKPHLITSLWHKDKLNMEKGKVGNTDYGFDMAKLFMTKNGSFENAAQIYEMLRYYFGKPDKSMNYEEQDFYKKKGIIPRIKDMCKGTCRTMQLGRVTSQLWFLPVGSNGLIEDKVKALLQILNDPEFKNQPEAYHYYCAVEVKDGISDNFITYMKDPHNIKKEIETLENEISIGKKGNRKNLIILTGNRLQLGISLRNVDIVAMWNTIQSTDAIFQMLFRSMTEVVEPECHDDGYCNQKKWGFMVDLNPQRAMTNVNLFSENINYAKQDSNKVNEYRQIIDLIDIDGDIINEVENKDEIINELFNKMYESWDQDVESIKKITEHFSFSPTFISQIENQLRLIKFSSKTTKILIQEAEDKIDPGKKKEKVSEKDKKQVEKEKKQIQEIPIEKLAAELVAELISLLNIFTLYLDGNSKCILLNEYKKNQNVNIMSDISKLKDKVFSDETSKSMFLKILNGRLGGDENKVYYEGVVDKVIKSITDAKDISYMEKIIFSQKKQYYGIRDPDKLLEDINNNLAPKDKERKEKGEVFTPIKIVEDMLKELPPDVWTNPNLKWLDPAVGIGNFPVIAYLKLMKGLEQWEPDEEKRRKHILEKMLYMVEVSEKSIFILNKVFCGKTIDNKEGYDLNIFHGSFVEGSNYADINKPDPVYNPNFGFDVIMGNPPYNQGGVGKGGGVFWKKFVDKSLDLLNENGYLTMIHPTGWRKPAGERASGGDIWKEFRKYNLIYVNISDIKIKHFPKVDYYVLNKSNIQEDTHLVNVFENKSFDGYVNLYNLPFIPNFVNKEIISIFNRLFTKEGDKFNIVYNQSFKPNATDKEKTTGVPHTFYYIPESKEYVKVFKDYDEEKKPDYIDKPKIILTYNGGKRQSNLYAKYYNNPIGGTNNTMYQLITEIDNYKNQLYLLNSVLMHCVLKLTQYSAAPNYKNEFKIINMITKPNEGNIKNNDDLYEYYGINKTEQKLIEEIVDNSEKPKPKKKDKKTISKQLNSKKSSSNLKTPDITTPVKTPVLVKSPPSKSSNKPSSNKSSSNKAKLKDKFYDKKLKCESEGKLWNPDTKRCLKDTSANRKKLNLTIKKPKSNSNSLDNILNDIKGPSNMSLEIEELEK